MAKGKKILDQIKTLKDNGRLITKLFKVLPSKSLYPDYYKFIKHPICLNDMDEKLSDGKYSSLDDLKADILLMCTNAKTYNDPESEIYADATTIETHTRQLIDEANQSRRSKSRKSIGSSKQDVQALLNAVTEGNLNQVKSLVSEKGVHPDVMGKVKLMDIDNEFEWAALHCAALYGHKDIAEFLLQSGASIELQDALFQGRPLAWAAYGGHVDLCKLLVKNYHANILAENVHGQRPIDLVPNPNDDIWRFLKEKRDSKRKSTSGTSNPPETPVSASSEHTEVLKIRLISTDHGQSSSKNLPSTKITLPALSKIKTPKSPKLKDTTIVQEPIPEESSQEPEPMKEDSAAPQQEIVVGAGHFVQNGEVVTKRRRGRPKKSDVLAEIAMKRAAAAAAGIPYHSEDEGDHSMDIDGIVPQVAGVLTPTIPADLTKGGRKPEDNPHVQEALRRQKMIASFGIVSNNNLLRHVLTADVYSHSLAADANIRTINFRVLLSPKAAGSCRVIVYHNKKILTPLPQNGPAQPSIHDFTIFLASGMNLFEVFALSYLPHDAARGVIDTEQYALFLNRFD